MNKRAVRPGFNSSLIEPSCLRSRSETMIESHEVIEGGNCGVIATSNGNAAAALNPRRDVAR